MTTFFSEQKLTYSALFLLLFSGFSCKSPKVMVAEEKVSPIRVEILDTMEVMADDEHAENVVQTDKDFSAYRSSPTQDFDLIHTDLEVRFDWEKQQLIGKATVKLVPHFYPQQRVVLDAVSFNISSVVDKTKNTSLDFSYDNKELIIDMGAPKTRKDTLIFEIDYVAKPNEGPKGGSQAITADKGLYFINPTGAELNKPTQIWTQGETQSNSRWFPTIDRPNQRSSQRIAITVDPKYSTLSNGKKVQSRTNADGTRTDIWEQKLSHAPYLFMMAVGEFAWVEDKYKDIPLYYIVEPAYKPYAKEIFNHTPEMMDFFSKKLDFPYVWDKYAQIIVRDYVSGAMENTSASVFGEFIQKTDAELIDDGNDYIVAHELFHHWFGDLVTPESWSNLTLNEGFANYSEYLWFEHKYGKLRADEHRIKEKNEYLQSALQGVHPLIDFYYEDKENMFDAHSYNKGGLILHMLRQVVGDEAFFTSLNHYLVKHQFSTVEADDLRISFEEVTGQDLNWFFDEWFFTEGHPVLNVNTKYDAAEKRVLFIVEQTQENLYKIPFDAAIYLGGQKRTERLWLDQRVDTLIVKQVETQPVAAVLDGANDILAVFTEDKSSEFYFGQFSLSDELEDRLTAFQQLVETPYALQVIEQGLTDESYEIRASALDLMEDTYAIAHLSKINEMVLNDKHSIVRQIALQKLAEVEEPETVANVIESLLKKEKAVAVISTAIGTYVNIDADRAIVLAKERMDNPSDALAAGLAYAFTNSEDPMYLDWYTAKLKNGLIYTIYPVFELFANYLGGLDKENVIKGATALSAISMDPTAQMERRFFSTKAISDLRNALKEEVNTLGLTDKKSTLDQLNQLLSDIKKKETNPQLRSMYAQF